MKYHYLGLLLPQTDLISSWRFVRISTRQLAVNSLSKGISSTLKFNECIDTDGTRTRNVSHCKQASHRLSQLTASITAWLHVFDSYVNKEYHSVYNVVDYPGCKHDDYACSNGQCIEGSRRCDMITDCVTESDELRCGNV